MIENLDKIRCDDSLNRIESSTLEPHVKDELKSSIYSAMENLNGRTMEERVLAIARNQFDTTRFLAEIIIQFKRVTDKAGVGSGDADKDGTDKPAGKRTMAKVALKWISENQFFVLLVVLIVAIQGGNIGAYIAKLLGM